MGQKSNGESAEKGIRSKITLVDMAGMDSVESFDSENTRKKNGRLCHTLTIAIFVCFCQGLIRRKT